MNMCMQRNEYRKRNSLQKKKLKKYQRINLKFKTIKAPKYNIGENWDDNHIFRINTYLLTVINYI